MVDAADIAANVGRANPAGLAPTVIDCQAAIANSAYIIAPGVRIYSLLWMGATVVTQFRFSEGTPWIPITSGDYYRFDPPIQSGILFDFAGGAGSLGIAIYSSQPCGLGVE